MNSTGVMKIKRHFVFVALPLAMYAMASVQADQSDRQPDLTFLDDVSLWHSEVKLHDDPTRFEGRYIDGVVIGNGSMLAIEGMTTQINRFNKSRLTDSRLHGENRFNSTFNGFAEHLSRSARLPLHFFQWVSGPIYTAYPTAYGFQFSMEYSTPDGEKAIHATGWNHETQHRIRNTSIVKNVVSTEDITVVSIDFMLPDKPVLIRNITVANIGTQDFSGCQFNVAFYVDPRNWTGAVEAPNPRQPGRNGALPSNELEFYINHVKRSPPIHGRVKANAVLIESRLGGATPGSAGFQGPKKLMLVYSPEAFGKADKQFVQFNLGELKRGESRTFNVFIVTAVDETSLQTALHEVEAVPVSALLKSTYKFWKTKIQAADEFAVPVRKDISLAARDYLDNVRLFLLALHTKSGGSIAHPYSYNSIYFRDGYDVYRAMLALGHREECRKTILFFKEAMHLFGIEMSYSPTAFELAPRGRASRIDDEPASEGFARSEYMLFFPLMVRDYHAKFGNDELVQSVYFEMKKAFDAQPVVGDGLIRYSGDEISVKRGPPQYRYSPQNAAMYVVDAQFLENVASKLGQRKDAEDFEQRGEQVAQALEKRFWSDKGFYAYSADVDGRADERPNVFCQALPYFYGHLRADDPRLALMIQSVLKSNTFPSFRVSTLPIDGRRRCPNNGNSIGLLLYLMSLANHPDAGRVFDRMLADSGTMGTTGEYLLVTNDGISRGERLRAHETGFNLCAALEYLKEKTDDQESNE